MYIEWLRGALEKSFEHARDALRRAASRQKREYDKKAATHGYSIGQWVYRWYPPAAHAKFGSGWTGPYLVINKLSDLVYQIQASKRSKPKVVHLDHLKPYYTNDDENLVNWLEKPTNTEVLEKPSESPHEDAGSELTQEEVVQDVLLDDDLDHQEEHRDSRVFSGGERVLDSETARPRHSKRTIRRPRRYLHSVNHSCGLGIGLMSLMVVSEC